MQPTAFPQLSSLLLFMAFTMTVHFSAVIVLRGLIFSYSEIDQSNYIIDRCG